MRSPIVKSALLLGGFIGLLVAGDEEAPVGWIDAADQGATLTPRGARTVLPVQPGDFLFTGDTLASGLGAVTYYFCPDPTAQAGQIYNLHGTLTLQTKAEVTALATLRTVGPARPCMVPTLERQPDLPTIPSPDTLGIVPLSAKQLGAATARLPGDQRAAVEAALTHPEDPRNRLAAAVLFERAGLRTEAAWEYFQLATVWPDQPRLIQHLQRVLESPSSVRMLDEPSQVVSQQDTGKGKIYALVVGISDYDQAPRVPNLLFASRDAAWFAEYLRSRRGGPADVTLLQDAQATTGAIRNYFLSIKQKARQNDTVWLFVAAHGGMLRASKRGAEEDAIPSIITHYADPEYVGLSSFSLEEAQDWMLGKRTPFGHAMIFLDICHAGYFAQFRTSTANTAKNYFGILATNPGWKAFAYENKIFNGGHGVFTYFLLRGLNTDEARAPGDSYIRAGRLSAYVQNSVQTATQFRQVPTPMVGTELDEVIADFNEPGIEFKQTPIDQLLIPSKDLDTGRRSQRKLVTSDASSPLPAQAPESPKELKAAIDLEDRGEKILLDYLKGEEVPQTPDEFNQGAQIFNEALQRQPRSPYLSARASFCEGRYLVFRKRYPDALKALQRAIRLEPRAAYAYNALGIAYLEMANYVAAENAFLDAIERAPLWAYPRHNLALTYSQQGLYDNAIGSYRAAMERAPQYFYLPYNLGVLYTKLNQQELAQEMYRRAIELAPGRAEPLTALGQLEFARGDTRAARRDLKSALDLPGQTEAAIQAARHNYALLLAAHRETMDEALQYWKENGDYLPSQFSAAQTLARYREVDRAIGQYQHILTLVPKSVATRLELLEFLEKGRRPVDDRIAVLQDGLRYNPRNPILEERLALVLLAAGRIAEAKEAFGVALESTHDAAAHERIKRIMKTSGPATRP
jgi:tetratricopeptide (TPR) repeat protein